MTEETGDRILNTNRNGYLEDLSDDLSERFSADFEYFEESESGAESPNNHYDRGFIG